MLMGKSRIVPIQDQPTIKYNNINTHQSSSLLICYTEGDVHTVVSFADGSPIECVSIRLCTEAKSKVKSKSWIFVIFDLCRGTSEG
jgi:hypothetical protein